MLLTNPKSRGILIVDDEGDLRQVIAECLGDAGYTCVLQAADGTEALSKLAAHPEQIYVVLLDLRLPDTDGLKMMQHLSNIHVCPVGVVILTGFGGINEANRFYHLGTGTVIAMNFLTKPIRAKEIVDEVDRVLEAIHGKRIAHVGHAGAALHARLTEIDSQLACLPQIRETVDAIRHRTDRGLVAELGMELLKAIVIACAIVALLFLGVGDLVKRAIGLP
jgi:DNA-binding NtrC family response regulator